MVGLGAIVGGAHLFVEELLHVAEQLGVEPLVLSLVLAPLATELPEKANSFFWVREGKDSLALGNITGAMVFQSTIPIAVGLLLTDWDLDKFAVVSGCLGLAGGVIAYWALRRRGRFEVLPVAVWIAALRGVHRLRRGRPELGEGRRARRRRGSWARPSGRPARSCRSGPMMNVARCTPQYFLPYIDFSIQVPYASATVVVGVGEQGEVQ